MALDTTVAGETSDSYGSLAEANTYFADSFSLVKSEAWAALSDSQKERALRSATNILETIKCLDKESGGSTLTLPAELRDDYFYVGPLTRYDAVQRLQFPRNIDVDSSLNPFIPEAVKEAQFEQAVFLLSVDETAMANSLAGIQKQSVEAGPVRSYESYGGNATLFAPMAVALMRQFMRRTRRLERG